MITLEFQPPKSPDTNVLDLAVFPSLSKRVAKKNKYESLSDLDALWRNIQKAIQEYPADTLESAFDTKVEVLREIRVAKGANDYKLPHFHQ